MSGPIRRAAGAVARAWEWMQDGMPTIGTLTWSDARRWDRAETLQDLADLTEQWLAGQIKTQPGYFGPVDVDEDIAPGITAALRALCRAGMVPKQSQGGWAGPGYDGSPVTAMPVVEGYATQETYRALAHYLPGWVASSSVLVIRRRGQGRPVVGVWGQPLRRQDFNLEWSGAGLNAVDEARAAQFVAFSDPQWQDRPAGQDLWHVLHTAADRVIVARARLTAVANGHLHSLAPQHLPGAHLQATTGLVASPPGGDQH
jgi:hypothetical protein